MKQEKVSHLVFVITLALSGVGCNDWPDCEDSFTYPNTSLRACNCLDYQKEIPTHMCCNRDICQEANGTPVITASDDPDAVPKFRVEGMQTDPLFPHECTDFDVTWAYHNTMNGTLQEPAKYGLPDPVLEVSDPAEFLEDPIERAVPWGSIASGDSQEIREAFNLSATSYAAAIDSLPTQVSGTAAINVIVQEDSDACFDF